MSKQYLAGTLSPKEKYQIEDRLLENDFYFEAMDGLELVSWEQCQKHLEETESRIINEFSIDQGASTTQKITLTFLGLFVTGMLTTWYFTSGSTNTIDLSPTTKAPISTAANNQQPEVATEIKPNPKAASVDTVSKLTQDKIAVEKEPKKDLSNTKTVVTATRNEPAIAATPTRREINYAVTHITVGRIVDTRGIAIPDAVVSSGQVSDTTDKSGYYALKIAKGGRQILITHLETAYLVDIDTNQNWEIVLDIAKQVVHDYHPMNAANRFK